MSSFSSTIPGAIRNVPNVLCGSCPTCRRTGTFYPGTGDRQETGGGAGQGTTLNLPIEFGTARQEYLKGFEVEDFGQLTDCVRAVADQHAGGRVVSLLEGGYNTEILPACVAEHLDHLREVRR